MQLKALAASLAVLATLVVAAPLRPIGTLDIRATADPEFASDTYRSYQSGPPSKRVAGTIDPKVSSGSYDHSYSAKRNVTSADPELLSDTYRSYQSGPSSKRVAGTIGNL